jgi:hypothetical protein
MRSDARSFSRYTAAVASLCLFGEVPSAHADRIGPRDLDADALVLSFDEVAHGTPISNDFECSARVLLRSTAPIGAEFSTDPADSLQRGEAVSAFVAAIAAMPENATASSPNKIIATKYDARGELVLCERCGIALHFLDPLPTKVGLSIASPASGQVVMFSGPTGLLGSVVVVSANGKLPEFVGWEDPGGITQIILRSRPGAGIGFDDLALSGAGSIVCASSDTDADTPIPDMDSDGEPDVSDLCPGTSADTPVDTAGCSIVQFCSNIDATHRAGHSFCVQGDWMNDEPFDPRDCKLRPGRSRGEDRCLAR